MFLTREEVAELTGYKQVAKQIAHLKSQRIPFHLDRYGRPKIAKGKFDGQLDKPVKPKTWSPTWAGDQP